jgi:urease accessory protein
MAGPLAAAGGFDGATAIATFVYAADDAPARLDLARRLTDGPRAGATCVGGVLIARWLDDDASRLRGAYGDFWSAFRAEVAGRPRRTPRVWQI